MQQWGFRDEVQKPELQAICKLENVGITVVNTDKESGETAEALLKQYPKLHGIYASMSAHVAAVVAAVKKSGRKDVWVASWYISEANAKMLLEGGPLWDLGRLHSDVVKGKAMVDAMAKWHLGHDLPLFIRLPSMHATPVNVEQAWRFKYAGTTDETPPWVKGKEWVDFLKSVGKA